VRKAIDDFDPHARVQHLAAARRAGSPTASGACLATANPERAPHVSEYQYYEFQAIDRALGLKEMAYLRGYSTRATITPTSFVNHYEWVTSRVTKTRG
jgi:hypothetical protein